MTERKAEPQATTWAALLRAVQARAPADIEALDAELLLAHALGRTRAGLYARLSDPVDPSVAARFEAFWRRRCQGEPYAYLVGEREFYGRMFAVAPGVLIPRADTETLLEGALARWPLTQHGTVVDAGTGSGALAVSFQLERPAASVYAVDRSAASLRIAQANARRLRAPVRFWCGDWLGALADGSVDLLLSNPPYLSADDSHLPGLIAAGEPRSALVADADGLADLLRLALAGRRVLRAGAWLLMEHGWTQSAAVRELLIAHGYQSVTTESDLSGHPRVTGGQAP